MCAKLGMAVQAMSGPAMFQALQTGALDAGEFIGPWSDSALGIQQVVKNYYWPGVGEPSSAEECGINLKVWTDLPADLKAAVETAAKSLYNDVTTEYNTKHGLALRQLVQKDGVIVRELPKSVIDAMSKAAGEVIAEMRDSADPMIKKITQSFLDYRGLMKEYMTYADNGQMNARSGSFTL
jgi:TRAP-type mannitol/chloroaromatic compound transport system substrate-binding protein